MLFNFCNFCGAPTEDIKYVMKNKSELIQYKKELENSFGDCSVLTVNHDSSLKNSEGTSTRGAEKGWTWIDYWRSMTGIYETRLSCSSCGEDIYVGDIPRIMNDFYLLTGDDPERHKACGGHVWVNTPSNQNYPGGSYITPLCPSCNNKRGEIIPILKGSKICKEIGAHVKEEE